MTAIVGEAINEYGTPASVLKCPACGQTVTVCPVIPAERQDQWTGCLGVDCPSYEPLRDADTFFDALMENGLIQRGDA